MLLAIAFLMFAILMIAWLTMPESEPQALPEVKPIRSENDPVSVSA